MDTHHHTVSLRVKSVLDSCGGADELNGKDDDMQEVEASQQVTPWATWNDPKAQGLSSFAKPGHIGLSTS